MEYNKITAIVLAAGQGKRMNSKLAKQYMLLGEKPVLYYSLKAFQDSKVDNIILVTKQEEINFCQVEIVEKYKFHKVTQIIQGGKERYHSVYSALCNISQTDYVLIHDGARPFVSGKIIEDTINEVIKSKACIVGMPIKDTIKIADDKGMVQSTPQRDRVWIVQTPQAFEFSLIKQAYDRIIKENNISVTDDAMVLEHTLSHPVKIIYGDYKNIKITTKEDIKIAETFMESDINKE